MTDLDLSFTLCDSNGLLVGEVDESVGRTFSQIRNLPASAEIKIRMEEDLAAYLIPSRRPRLKIHRAATAAELAANPASARVLLFYGLLPSTSVDDDTDTGITTATFFDPRVRLGQAYTFVPVTFTATAQGTVLWQLVNTYQGRSFFNSYLLQGATDASRSRDRTYDQGKQLSTLIDEMTKVEGGPDVDVSPLEIGGSAVMGTFNTYARQGLDRPNALFISGPKLPTNCTVKRNWGPTVTFATAQGTAPDGNATAQSYPPIITSGYGLLESYETISDASVAATLLARAAGVVDQNQDPQQILTVSNITRDAPVPFIDYFLGDTVRVTAKRGAMNIDRAPVRAEAFKIEVGDNGRATVTSLTTSGD